MKKTVRIIIFIGILIALFHVSNNILVEKATNRYYMLSKELKNQEKYDVQIFGSCHAYTSFNPVILEEEYGISSYNMSNPSEIMPATYLRIAEQIKKNKPQVILVETWGINAYETYMPTEEITDLYFRPNIENIPFSKEKLQVIEDFEALDVWEDNFPIFKYKDRLLDFSLSEIDFKYSFERTAELYKEEITEWMYREMRNRFKHNGFLSNGAIEVLDYEEQQNHVEDDEILKIESDIMKYVDKIIELCSENDVEVIFYRAPYVSSKNELKKINYLEGYLKERNIRFYDLEKEIEFDYEKDFKDYQHLSKHGAKKATEFLNEKIMERME